MKKEKSVRTSIMLIICCWLPVLIFCQPPEDSVRMLNEIVITATKFPISRMETGKVIAVINAEQIRKSEGKSLAQLLHEQSGLDINGANSSPGKDKSVYLRGSPGQYTLIVMDGVPLTDASGVGGAFDLRLIPLDQIERIEILKGSQSTLYGSDAIAGVIHIITGNKVNRPLGGHALVSGGSFKTRKGVADFNGISGVWEYHAGFSHDQTEGISEAKEPEGKKLFDRDGYRQNSIHLNLTAKPLDGMNLKTLIRYSAFHGRYDAGAFTDDVSAEYRSKFFEYGLNGQYQAGKGMLQGYYHRACTERKFESVAGTYPYKGRSNNLDLFYNHNLNKYIQWSTGFSLQEFHLEADQTVIENPSAKLYSAHASGYFTLKGFSSELGGRINYHTEFGEAFTFSVNPSYRINPAVKLFANYSTGFKAPTLNELFGRFGANQNLKPQDGRNIEAGMHFYSLRAGQDFRITAFDRKIINAIVYGTMGYINLDRQSDHGLELETGFRPHKKIDVKAFYNYVTGSVKTRTVENRDTSFHNLLRRATNTLGGSIAAEITKNLSTSLLFKSVGRRRDTYFDPNTFTTAPVVLDAYFLLNFYAARQWAAGKWKWFLDVKNLLNEDYSEVFGYNALKFNLNTGVSYKF